MALFLDGAFISLMTDLTFLFNVRGLYFRIKTLSIWLSWEASRVQATLNYCLISHSLQKFKLIKEVGESALIINTITMDKAVVNSNIHVYPPNMPKNVFINVEEQGCLCIYSNQKLLLEVNVPACIYM